MNGGDLIRNEIENNRNLLVARKNDVAKAKRYLAEMEEACSSLANKICRLEQDQKALVRGNVALMCDLKTG